MAEVACAIVVALVTLAGCATTPAPAPTTATPTTAPVFASDEEALAAATEAYARFQEMSDQIDNDGGGMPERIAPFVSESYYPLAVEQSDGFREARARSVGMTSFLVDSAQQLAYPSPEETSISLYVCDDVTEVDVIDEHGVSMVSDTRAAITPFEVGFVMNSEGTLVVDSRDVWKGTNFC